MMLGTVLAAMILGVAAGGADGREDEGMLPLLKRHEIQILLSVGLPLSAVAAKVGVSVDTVSRVRAEEAVSHVDDAAERKRRRVGRPSKAARFEEDVRGWLEETPELPTQELLRRAVERGYDGAKSAFYAMVSSVRPPRNVPVVRFEGLPGEFTQHDFGHVDVTYVEGRKERVHFFASRLKYSRYVAVSLVPNEQVETLVRTMVRHFHAFEGVPLLAVFDRPRTIVRKSGRGRDVEKFHATFAQVMLELGVGAEMCAPRSGNQKGAVEHLVKWVKNSFFKWRKFVDAEDLETQLAAWVQKVNHETPSRATGVIPAVRHAEELARLRPVRIASEELALRVPVFVGPTAEVMFEARPYLMPPEATNVPGTAFVYEDRIRFVVGRHEVEHQRGRPGDPPASLPEHRAAKLAAVHGARAKTYEKRQQLLHLGEDALTLLTALVHRSSRHHYAHVDALYALYEEHGDVALRAAFAQVVDEDTLTIASVREVLERNRSDRAQVELPLERKRAASPRGRRASKKTKRSSRTVPKGARR